IIMVARFEKPKNQTAVLQALAAIEIQNWHLELVGDGPELAKCVLLAEQLNIARKVTFSGACSDVAVRLGNSDIFVLTSDWEGLPLTILEAMRSSLPVIASDVGGVAESIDDGVTGILVPRDYTVALRNAFVQLLQSQGERESMGYKAREKFEQEFTFDLMLRKTLDVYQLVLEERT
ncbi:glycosyltransferase, partial [Pseudomonas sp. FSL R10-0071]